MARSELGKIQLKCGVKTGFEVGHGIIPLKVKEGQQFASLLWGCFERGSKERAVGGWGGGCF